MADYSRLPGPNADLWDWQLRGLCRGKDSSLFFHPEGERGAARAAREQSAKEICLNCPVQKQCCEHALRVREPYGVWGGMTEEERELHYQRQKALMRARAVREKAALAEKAKLKEKLLRDRERELARLAKAQENTAARGRGSVDGSVHSGSVNGSVDGGSVNGSVDVPVDRAAALPYAQAAPRETGPVEAGPVEAAEPAAPGVAAPPAAPAVPVTPIETTVPVERMTPAEAAAAAQPVTAAETQRNTAPELLAAAERMAPVEHEAPADAMVPADAARPLSTVAPPNRPGGRAVAPAKKIPAAAKTSPRKRSTTKVPESV